MSTQSLRGRSPRLFNRGSRGTRAPAPAFKEPPSKFGTTGGLLPEQAGTFDKLKQESEANGGYTGTTGGMVPGAQPPPTPAEPEQPAPKPLLRPTPPPPTEGGPVQPGVNASPVGTEMNPSPSIPGVTTGAKPPSTAPAAPAAPAAVDPDAPQNSMKWSGQDEQATRANRPASPPVPAKPSAEQDNPLTGGAPDQPTGSITTPPVNPANALGLNQRGGRTGVAGSETGNEPDSMPGQYHDYVKRLFADQDKTAGDKPSLLRKTPKGGANRNPDEDQELA